MCCWVETFSFLDIFEGPITRVQESKGESVIVITARALVFYYTENFSNNISADDSKTDVKVVVLPLMSDFVEMQKRVIVFRNERDWGQFHNAKDLAIALNLEAAEVLEHFLWKTNEEVTEYLRTNKSDIGEELADALYYILLMAHDLNIDLPVTFDEKMAKNEGKYTIAKAKGNHKKYTELEKE